MELWKTEDSNYFTTGSCHGSIRALDTSNEDHILILLRLVDFSNELGVTHNLRSCGRGCLDSKCRSRIKVNISLSCGTPHEGQVSLHELSGCRRDLTRSQSCQDDVQDLTLADDPDSLSLEPTALSKCCKSPCAHRKSIVTSLVLLNNLLHRRMLCSEGLDVCFQVMEFRMKFHALAAYL